MKQKVKQLIKKVLKAFGYKIHKYSTPTIVYKNNTTFTMQAAIKRCVARGVNANTVIDVGASDGRWSKACMDIIPNAKYLLVEAQEAHKKGLDQLKKENTNVSYVLAAAGKKNGTIYFNNKDLFGGLASETNLEENCVKVPMICLDSEIEKRNLKPPYVLKLDTHGFEIPILEGAKNILKQAQLVIIETYNYKLTNTSLKYYEMCMYMEKLGFSSVEMVDFMLRTYDDTFWQMDTFFVPTTNKEFLYTSYK
ncbi:FkbM family methyltransferase [uncultured Lutibacter sp.]|uniref:FkbM family methyltransferase n=1 Tax=uncultured Lutibacter sp. TaxID=437739 RepID=UPI00262B7EBE|nr:FkbM family methyltransferase [uncultured Lutibacter sp.]